MFGTALRMLVTEWDERRLRRGWRGMFRRVKQLETTPSDPPPKTLNDRILAQSPPCSESCDDRPGSAS
jgi:hypothetical protein